MAKLSKTVRTDTKYCPFCNHAMGAASGVDFEGEGAEQMTPSPGDIALCVQCTEWAFYDDDLKLRRPTHEEYEHIASDLDLRKVRTALLLSKAVTMLPREKNEEGTTSPWSA